MKYLLIATALVYFMSACKNKTEEKQEPILAKTILTDSHFVTSCPFLTKDTNDNIVLSFIKEINDSVAVMSYSVSKDKGVSFGNAIEIPASKDVLPSGENMPKMVFKPNGEIIAVWGVENSNPINKYSGLVYYSQSFDDGKNWSEAKALVKDTASFDQRYFDVALLKNGEAGIIWLDNRKNTEKEGSTLYYATTQGKNGFENEKPIAEKLCQCCRTDLFLDSSDNIHAAYRAIVNDTVRDMTHIVSIDGGKTFSQPKRISEDNWAISACPHTGPSIAQNKNGLHFAWHTMGGGEGVFYCSSSDNGETFSKRENISSEASARHPQITALPNGELVTVWDESVQNGENYNSWIGLQRRNEKGEVISKEFITSNEMISEFPLVRTIDDNSVLLIWVQKERAPKNAEMGGMHHSSGKGGQVYFKRMVFE